MIKHNPSKNDNIVLKFREWLNSEDAIKQRKIIADEKKEVKELVEKLSKMDKKSPEFTDEVLYALLPYHETKFAKRTSAFPVFLNIKPFFKDYKYLDKDWNLIANMIFSLVEKSQREPEKIGQWITEFTANKIHSRRLQCGAITPILFCINDSFFLINNKIINTYKHFSEEQGWDDDISQKLEKYTDSIPKCQRLIDFLGIEELRDAEIFDLFCWKYDVLMKDDLKDTTNKTSRSMPKNLKNFKKETQQYTHTKKTGRLCKNWIWPVTQENWPQVRDQKIWGVGSTPGKGKYVSKGDKIVFYVKSSGYFQGVFEVTSDWHEPTTTWIDSKHSAIAAEINLKPIHIGYASLKKLLENLDFIEKKKHAGVYLRGTTLGPANSGKPISDDDYKMILDELKLVSEKPAKEFEIASELKEFISTDSWDFIQERIHDLPPPNLKSIDSIINNVNDGKYAIPIFQREYTWSRKQVEELWESIFQGFFVGSILTWDYDGQIDVISAYGAPQLQNPKDIVLDGQQRITSLFHAVVNPDMAQDSNRRILYFVDLRALLNPDADTTDIVFSESEDKAKKLGYLEKENQHANKIFPLTQFHRRDYTMWLSDFKTYLKDTEAVGSNAEKYFEQIMKILDHVWFKYTIPIVQLPKSLSLDSVAEIFEKINSTGTKLGVFDLLNARFTKYKIELRSLLDTAKSDFPEIQDMEENFEDAAKYTLQGLCLIKKGYSRRKELLTLDKAYKESKSFQKNEFLKDWSDTCKYISAAISKIKSHREGGFGAVSLKMVPYTVMIPILAALLYKIDKRNDRPKCMQMIEKWYWSAVTSDSYSGSTDTKIEKDYRELLKWFDDDSIIPEIVMAQQDNIDSLEISTTRTNDSVYKAIMCIISKTGANDFLTDNPPEYSKLDDHHIFPKSMADEYSSSTISINSILNRTVIDNNTNRNSLRNKKPSEYIKEIIREQDINKQVMQKRLRTHLISDIAFDCLSRDDFVGFVRAREQTIREALHQLIIPSEKSDNDTRSLLYNVESQNLEYKSTLRWDLKLRKVNTALEDVVCKEMCAFMNTGGGDLLLGVNDDGVPIGLEADYLTLKSKNYDGFIQHITNLINKYFGKNANSYVSMEQIQTENGEICKCSIKQSQKPIFLNKDGEKKFFIRANNTCQPLDAEEAHHYSTEHWN